MDSMDMLLPHMGEMMKYMDVVGPHLGTVMQYKVSAVLPAVTNIAFNKLLER